MYKYVCDGDYKRVGQGQVHCADGVWDLIHPPVCTSKQLEILQYNSRIKYIIFEKVNNGKERLIGSKLLISKTNFDKVNDGLSLKKGGDYCNNNILFNMF